jgi:uncharacterized protein (TIGR00369 family)
MNGRRVADGGAAVPADTAWGRPRSRVVSWYDPAAIVALGGGMSGLEFMRALAAGVIPAPPMAALLRMWPVEVEAGRVVFACTPDESVYNPIGVVHGGLVCTLADSAAGCAVHTTLGAGVGYTSIGITVTYLRPVTTGSGTLTATGVVVKPGRRVATATVEVADGSGRLVATASSSCLVIPGNAGESPGADGGGGRGGS